MLVLNKAKKFKLYSEGLKRGWDFPSRMGERMLETDKSRHYLIAKCSSIQKIPGKLDQLSGYFGSMLRF